MYCLAIIHKHKVTFDDFLRSCKDERDAIGGSVILVLN